MQPDPSRTAEALLSQSDWVRALVRGLGVDESGADDVVQSTWLAALSKPPRSGAEGASFRAWVARVARNFALRGIDRDARRAGRERDSAQEERLPSAADVVEREEARAEVVRALLDVHEPYRTALLLRFYEGLEPRDIARLQSVPASTVRNRLKRGLALLRERLEASQGATWRQRCLLVLPAIHPKPLAVPPASYPTAAAAASGGALVIKSLGIAATVALAAGGAYFTWHRATSSNLPVSSQASARSTSASGSAGSAPSSPSGPGGAASHSRISRADSQLVAAMPASARAPAAEASEAAASAEQDDGTRCTVHGRILRSDGTPLALANDRVRLLQNVLARQEQEVALFEKFVVEGRQLTSGANAKGTAPPQSEESLADESIDVERRKIELSQAVARRKVELLQQKVRAGHDLAPTALPPEAQDKIKLEVAFEPARFRPPHVLVASAGGDARELDVDSEGNFAFGDLCPDRWRLFATAPGFTTKRMEFEIRRGETAKQLEVVLDSSTQLRVKLATPDGRDLLTAVAEELGDRFAPVPFAMRTQPGPRITGLDAESESRVGSGRWRGRQGLDEATVGDASGVLELSDSLPLHVGIAACGSVLEERLVPAGAQEVVFVVPLERIRALVSGVLVRIVSERDQQPIAGASVRIEEFAGAVTGEDGMAELAGIPPGLHEIRFFADGTEERAEWVSVAPGVKTDLGVRSLGRTVAIRGRVVDEDGAPVEAKLQLRSIEGRSPDRELAVCDAAATDAEGRFVLEKAGAREYVLTVAAGDRAASIERIDATRGTPPEIVIRAAIAGDLALTFPVEPPPGAVYVVETHGFPVHVQPAEGWRPLVAKLGDGDYRATMIANGGAVWTRRVLIQPGQMIAFDETKMPR